MGPRQGYKDGIAGRSVNGCMHRTWRLDTCTDTRTHAHMATPGRVLFSLVANTCSYVCPHVAQPLALLARTAAQTRRHAIAYFSVRAMACVAFKSVCMCACVCVGSFCVHVHACVCVGRQSLKCACLRVLPWFSRVCCSCALYVLYMHM